MKHTLLAVLISLTTLVGCAGGGSAPQQTVTTAPTAAITFPDGPNSMTWNTHAADPNNSTWRKVHIQVTTTKPMPLGGFCSLMYSDSYTPPDPSPQANPGQFQLPSGFQTYTFEFQFYQAPRSRIGTYHYSCDVYALDTPTSMTLWGHATYTITVN